MGKKKAFLSTYPKLLSLCISSLFVICVSHSQPLPFTTLYQQYLPERAIENTVHRQNIEEMLAAYARLDPDLIYYACENLRLKIDNGVLAPDSNFTNILSSMLKRARQRRTDWVRSQINSCDSNVALALKRQSINRYLSDLDYGAVAIGSSDTIPIEKDSNRIDFFNLVFFSRDRQIVYEPRVNYKQLCYAEINRLVQRYSALYERLNGMPSNERMKLVESAQNDVLAFQDNYLQKHGLKPDVALYRFIERAISDDFMTRDMISISVVSDISPLTYHETFQSKDPLTLRLHREFDAKLWYPVNLLLGVNFVLKPEFEPFSYVHCAVGFSAWGVARNSGGGETVFNGSRAAPGIQFVGRYFFDDVRAVSANMVSAEIRSPIFFSSRWFSIEVGLGFQHHWSKFSLSILRDGRYVTLDPLYQDLREAEVVTYTRTRDELYGVFSLKFSPSPSFDITGDFIPPRVARLRAGFNILF